MLEQELKYYKKHKAELLTHYEGQVALIKGNALHGTFTKADEAFEKGVHLFGNTPFLIRAILEEEQVEYSPSLSTGVISALLQ